MTAAELRSAAALMRSRAEAVKCPEGDENTMPWVEEWPSWPRIDPMDAEHIASWHPAVALAVADWLEFEANCTDRAAKQFPSQQWDADERALAVARAYLGDQS